MAKECLAFKTEFYHKEAKPMQIEADLKSFLGEYHFEIPEYNYQLRLSEGRLVDLENIAWTEKTKKAIERKKRDGEVVIREEAELRGFQKIEEGLGKNPFGTVVWFSPPGAKEDGYGDYGFVYLGKRQGQGLQMTAFRLEENSMDKFNQARNQITEEDSQFTKAEDFIKNPVVLNRDEKELAKQIKENFTLPSYENLAIFNKAMKSMEGIMEYVSRNLSRDALFALENMAIELIAKEKLGTRMEMFFPPKTDLPLFVNNYSYEPPKVAGSCGSSGGKSSDIFKSTSVFLNISEDKYGSRTFKCPRCGEINIRPKDKFLSACQHCNSTEVACE